jgi:hypothetical protein
MLTDLILCFILVLDGCAGLWWRKSTCDDHPDRVFKIQMYMKQGLSFLASTFIFLKILRVRTSWVDSERVTECLEYRQESNELSPSYILLVSCLLQLCSKVKHDLPSTSVHHRTICYFDNGQRNGRFQCLIELELNQPHESKAQASC